jgi:hypothetical protein
LAFGETGNLRTEPIEALLGKNLQIVAFKTVRRNERRPGFSNVHSAFRCSQSGTSIAAIKATS